MNEYRAMIEAADRATGPVFLATVVEVEGSAYRREGARMLILPDGERVGSISGGCLERDLCRAAAELVRAGPRVVSFDTRADAETPNPRYNVGCSGVIHVLVEAVGGADCPLAPIRRALAEERAQILGTVYRADGAAASAIGTRVGPEALTGHFEALAPVWRRVERTGTALRAERRDAETTFRVLIETIEPPRPLWIFGAGEGVASLAALAAELGWAVTVIGGRDDAIDAAAFPRAERWLRLDPRDYDAHLDATPRTAAVVMTRNLDLDTRILPWLLARSLAYVGILGPKSRTARVLQALHAAHQLPPAAALDALHSPAGLDLGGATPATVALSIVAEIVAEDNRRSGGKLARREGPIHDARDTVMLNEPTAAPSASDPVVVLSDLDR